MPIFCLRLNANMAKYWQFVPRGRERWGAVNSTEAQARPDAPMTHRDTQRCGGSQGWEYCGVGEWRQGNSLPSHRAPTCIHTPSNQLQVPPPACKVQGCRLHQALKGSLHAEQSKKSQDFQGSNLRSVHMVIVCPSEQKKADPIDKKLD